MSTPRQEADIDRRPDGEYRVRVKPFPARQFTHLPDAIAHRDTLKRARQTGTMVDPNPDLIPLHALAAEHFAAEGPNLAQRTRENYNAAWANVRAHHIRDMPIRMITPKVVESFRDETLRKYKPGTGFAAVNKSLVVLSAVMSRGEVHYGHPNPVRKVTKLKTGRKATPKVISPDAVEKLRAKLDGADAVLVSVLAYSGMRPEEALALTWGDLLTRTINVDKAAEPDGTIRETKGKGRARRTRFLAPLQDDLTAFRMASGSPADDALIFPRADGGAWREYDYKNWTKRKFAKAAKDAGLGHLTPYALRRSAGSLWLHEGKTPMQVAGWLGHSLKTLSDHYAAVIDDLDPDDTRSAVEVIQAARQDNPRTTLRVLQGRKESGASGKPDAAKGLAAG